MKVSSRENAPLDLNTDSSQAFQTSIAQQPETLGRFRSAALVNSLATTTSLLARNALTGATQLWSSSNGAINRQDLASEPDLNWQVSGIADFNRDEQQDLLWRNSKTGEVRIWQLSNGTVQSIAIDAVNDVDWQVVGLADLNNDGSPDIVWQNFRSGEAAVWFLNGSSVASKQTIGSAGPGGWRIQGIADSNGSSSASVRAPELIWENIDTGQAAVWTLNNGKLAQGIYLDTAPSADWKIAAIGNFHGGSSPDLFWRNSLTGDTQFWSYKGAQRTQVTSGTSIDANWQSLGATDLNGDGTSDLLWRNSSTGELLGWFVQNGSVADSTSIYKEPELNWQPIAAFAPSASLVVTPIQSMPRPGSLTINGSISSAVNEAPVFALRDRVDAGNISDFYRFTIGQSGMFTAGLTGLTGDADVRLIQDINNNGSIDQGDILAWQWERGTANESIRKFIAPGTYFVQVLSYNNQTANYTVSTNFTAAASDDQQFRIALTFADSMVGLNSAARDAISQAAKFWEGVILNRSSITQSNTLSIALVGEGLVSQDGTADTGTLALSGPTLTLDAADNLVITRGGSTLNSRKFAEFNANPLYLRDIMIHEFAHILGFGTIWQPTTFKYSDGTTIAAGKNWINRTNATYRADSYAGSAYGDLLGTSTQTAIPIEPQIFYHWDESRFDTELMTPFAEAPGVPMPMSSLTLGALRDLGWSVNFGAAQPYSLPAQTTTQLSSVPATSGAAIRAAAQCKCGRCLSAVRTELSSTGKYHQSIGLRV